MNQHQLIPKNMQDRHWRFFQMIKKGINVAILSIISILIMGFTFPLIQVKAETVQGDNLFLGQDLYTLNLPLNTTMDYSPSEGEGLGYLIDEKKITSNFEASYGYNYTNDENNLIKKYFQFESVEHYGSNLFLDLYTFTDYNPAHLTFEVDDEWEDMDERGYFIEPKVEDVYKEYFYPLDLNASDILTNTSAPILIEAQNWKNIFFTSGIYNRIDDLVVNNINISLLSTGWNFSHYNANWTIKGYTFTNETISINYTLSKRINLNDDHILSESLSYFKQEICITGANFSSEITEKKELEVITGVSLKYRGNIQYNSGDISGGITIDDVMDDDWNEYNEEHYSSPFGVVLAPFFLMAIGIIVGIIVLVVIIRAIVKMGPASFPAEKTRAGYYDVSTATTNNPTIRVKSEPVSGGAETIKPSGSLLPKFCPICGSPVSDVMRELLQTERYAFCESCGEKITL